MKKALLIGVAFVSILSQVQASESINLEESSLAQVQLSRIENVKLVDLLKSKKDVYIRINQDILPGPQYNSVSKFATAGGIFSGDSYELNAIFSFAEARPYGERDNGKPAFNPIKKGTLLKVDEIDANLGRYEHKSLLSISAAGKRVQLAPNFFPAHTIFIQIHGSRVDSNSKLTTGELEKVFKNIFTFYSN